MEQLSVGASLPSIQDYVRQMEVERGLDRQDITSQCLKLEPAKLPALCSIRGS
jgi:hypothetical protein